jgi:magnesium-transporting ATPase (P-type)
MSYGVEVKMITGDHLLIAVETAKLLDLGDVILGGSPEEHVLPNIKTADGNKHVNYFCLFDEKRQFTILFPCSSYYSFLKKNVTFFIFTRTAST